MTTGSFMQKVEQKLRASHAQTAILAILDMLSIADQREVLAEVSSMALANFAVDEDEGNCEDVAEVAVKEFGETVADLTRELLAQYREGDVNDN